MAKAYPKELRERIVAAHDRGEGGSVLLARRFDVSRAFVCNLLRRRRETGSIEPLEYKPGPKRKLSEAQRDRLIELAGKRGDLTLEQLRRRLRLPVCLSVVHRELKEAGFSFKRSPSKLASNTAKTCSVSGSVGVDEPSGLIPGGWCSSTRAASG